mgnify:CR=1 FL=1
MGVFTKQIETYEELDEVLKLREIVFCKEQKVPLDEEIDEYDIIDDSKVLHFGIYVDDKLVGCSRVLIKEDYFSINIGLLFNDKWFRKTLYN